MIIMVETRKFIQIPLLQKITNPYRPSPTSRNELTGVNYHGPSIDLKIGSENG